MKKNRLSVLGAAVVLIGVVVAWSTRRVPDAEPNGIAKDDPSEGKVEVPSARQPKVIGGIERPASDVQFSRKLRSSSRRPVPQKRQGHSPFLSPDTNEQVAQVADALRDGSRPEVFSSFVIKQDFDLQRFKESPAEYAAVYASQVAPGRVFSPAQPGNGVPPIRTESKRFHRVQQGESVRLAVEAAPFAPVSFLSQNLGQFDNQLTSITVVADEAGIAQATFLASGGTIDEVQILAASPVTSGQAAFTVSVRVGS